MGTKDEAEVFVEGLKAVVAELKDKRETISLNQRDFIASTPPTFVLIDDVDAFVAYITEKATELAPLIQEAGGLGVCFITTSMSSKLKGFDAVTNLFKAPQAGMILGNPQDSLMHYPSANVLKSQKPTQGIGFWAKRGDFKKIKLPFIE